MMSVHDINIGDIFRVSYPFVSTLYTPPDPEEYGHWRWRPGTGSRVVYPDDCESVATAIGICILTVVSTHKPGRYPERVFFTREWEGPDGKVFGKTRLHITTKPAFRRLTQGFRYDYEIDPRYREGEDYA